MIICAQYHCITRRDATGNMVTLNMTSLPGHFLNCNMMGRRVCSMRIEGTLRASHAYVATNNGHPGGYQALAPRSITNAIPNSTIKCRRLFIELFFVKLANIFASLPLAKLNA